MNELKHFDREHIYAPDYADVRLFISLPRKTIFINDAAPRCGKIYRVGWTENNDLFRLPFEE